MALKAVRDLIGKSTDADLIEDITNGFNKMGTCKKIEEFFNAGNQVLALIGDLKKGNDSYKPTWRTHMSIIWTSLEAIKRKRGAEKKQYTMLGVLKNAEKAKSWFEKLQIYHEGTKNVRKGISSRWNDKVKEAAGKALDRIEKFVKDISEIVDKKTASGELREAVALAIANIFCTNSQSVVCMNKSGKGPGNYSAKPDFEVQTEIPLLRPEQKMLIKFNNIAFAYRAAFTNKKKEEPDDSTVVTIKFEGVKIKIDTKNEEAAPEEEETVTEQFIKLGKTGYADEQLLNILNAQKGEVNDKNKLDLNDKTVKSIIENSIQIAIEYVNLLPDQKSLTDALTNSSKQLQEAIKNCKKRKPTKEKKK